MIAFLYAYYKVNAIARPYPKSYSHIIDQVATYSYFEWYRKQHDTLRDEM